MGTAQPQPPPAQPQEDGGAPPAPQGQPDAGPGAGHPAPLAPGAPSAAAALGLRGTPALAAQGLRPAQAFGLCSLREQGQATPGLSAALTVTGTSWPRGFSLLEYLFSNANVQLGLMTFRSAQIGLFWGAEAFITPVFILHPPFIATSLFFPPECRGSLGLLTSKF